MTKRLLLLSGSKHHSSKNGSGFLDWAVPDIKDFLGPDQPPLLFIPYANPSGIGHDAYADIIKKRFAAFGYEGEVTSLHTCPPKERHIAIGNAKALFVGGGNTFRLLRALYTTFQPEGYAQDLEKTAWLTTDNSAFYGSPLLMRLRAAADKVPYIGSSAGTNLACPTIKNTNDMPIVSVPSLNALGLIPFQINPHYIDPDPNSTHQGETREERIREYFSAGENTVPVLGLREGCGIRVEGDRAYLWGERGARLFRKDAEPEERSPGASLDDLMTVS